MLCLAAIVKDNLTLFVVAKSHASLTARYFIGLIVNLTDSAKTVTTFPAKSRLTLSASSPILVVGHVKHIVAIQTGRKVPMPCPFVGTEHIDAIKVRREML